MRDNIYKIIAQQKKYLESLKYNVIYVGLYGSQNYGMSYDKSDIDLRAIVMPTLNQVIERTTISKKYVTPVGDIDVKDLLTYYEIVRKGNFSFIEPFQTKWFIGDKKLRELFGSIPLNLKSVKGAMLEKAKAFRHEYPSKKVEFKKWGYDPKQLHHIFRLMDLLSKKDDSISFIKYDDKDFMQYALMSIKINRNNIIDELPYINVSSFETIKEYINTTIKNEKFIPKDYKYDKKDLSLDISSYIKNNLKLEINNTNIKSARQIRTFGQQIPKNDIKKFPELEQYKGQDISYIVYESLEVL